MVDLNFRMDTSALYSDIVLPAATWYEKADLNSTDMHSFIHPLSAAVPPCWESKSDWQIFKAIAKKFSELAAQSLPRTGPRHRRLAAGARQRRRRSPSRRCRTGSTARSRRSRARPCRRLKVVTAGLQEPLEPVHRVRPAGPRRTAWARTARSYAIEDEYEAALRDRPTVTVDGQRLLSLAEDEQVCDTILRFATVTNGELAHRSYQNMEKKVGLPLTHLAERYRGQRISYKELQSQPQRFINSPMWSGLVTDGRAYSPFTYNVECLVPWRTLTGRQHFYLDHPLYLQFGEHLPTYKPKPLATQYADLKFSTEVGPTLMLNYLTPHGKWHIHTTYGDNERMTTLSRGCEPLWMNDRDAAEIGIQDNDWVEVHNDNGVVVTRAAVSARIPRGICIQYHSPERTYSVPKSPLRKFRRAGGHNSLTRTRLKPNLMAGGYGQFTFHFNYWGPVGCNRDTHILVRKLPELVW